MSDDAFASSHTSRRVSALSEAEYARMHDALMETSRGRWFLDEYARRNRNTDTTMVLDAVARIERVVSAQQTAALDPFELRDKIRQAIERARAGLNVRAASETENAMTLARRAARIIREIAWQMRACGNDPRICNILDAQLDAIDAVVHAPETDPNAHVRTMLDALIAEIESLVDGSANPSMSASDGEIAPVDTAGEKSSEDIAGDDDAVLARIAAEMATPDCDPDAKAFDEARAPPLLPIEPERRKDSLGAMLIARGIIQPRGDRDPSASQIVRGG